MADLEELRWADWRIPTASTPEELALARRIAGHLVKAKGLDGWGQLDWITRGNPDLAELVAAARGSREQLSLEYPIKDDIGDGRVDILLVDREAPKRVLAVEVKLRATLSPDRNPVPQVLRYRAALAAAAPGWTVESLVVAKSFQEAVIDEAERQAVHWRTCSARGHLYKPGKR